MTSRTADIVCLIAIGVTSLASILLYPSLPDPMPAHWNSLGEVDGYLPKFWGVVILPLVAALSWGVFKVVLRLTAKRGQRENLHTALATVQVSSVVFMTAVSALVLMAASGVGDFVGSLVPMGIGILFLVIGSVIGKVDRNNYLGIRTPWSLANDDNWRRTQRFAAACCLLAGLVMLLTSFGEGRPYAAISIVLVIALVGVLPVVYSYLLHRRLAKNGRD